MLAKIEYDNIFSLSLVKRKILRATAVKRDTKGMKNGEFWKWLNNFAEVFPINNHNSALKRLIRFIDCLRMAILRPPRI